ncbi:alpha/beta fold hydrolase [Lysobacter auxotrophicus]|uniref:Alpha/beta hydrolase n=1 Tax=Lysobacter auxotrophicus TaxID=2992573 RepID=A0ABM8DDI0_9GAMM|nr:alpha/beta hydrolase [Lysobacter auxotrophicus]BDU16622.1 alpha/beta hydrolase [Lysobacter auxotrophicus]
MSLLRVAVLALALATAVPSISHAGEEPARTTSSATYPVHHRRIQVEGVDLFYREAGPRDAPTLLLLHGFPTSSQMYRDLIPLLADRFHVIAPDYPGFGQSAAPSPSEFEYSFDNFAKLMDRFTKQLGLERYALYVMDYGAPVGFRLASAHPERVDALIVQNGNAYIEGIGAFWDPIKALWKDNSEANRDVIRKAALTLEGTRWQYLDGVPDPTLVSPDAYMLDQAYLDRPGNNDIQLAMIYDYRNNLPKYPQWQAYFRKHRPPTLVVWGKNDKIFLAAGAQPYRRDNPNAQVHLLDTGHFALETHAPQIATLIREFLERR